MIPKEHLQAPDWNQLLREFSHYCPAEDPTRFDGKAFRRALAQPPPAFVSLLIAGMQRSCMNCEQRVVLLYLFLLDLRYDRKLNLLHFAFNVFEDDSPLPREIIDRTPFPHEDGYPPFRYFGDPEFDMEVPPEPLGIYLPRQ